MANEGRIRLSGRRRNRSSQSRLKVHTAPSGTQYVDRADLYFEANREEIRAMIAEARQDLKKKGDT